MRLRTRVLGGFIPVVAFVGLYLGWSQFALMRLAAMVAKEFEQTDVGYTQTGSLLRYTAPTLALKV